MLSSSGSAWTPAGGERTACSPHRAVVTHTCLCSLLSPSRDTSVSSKASGTRPLSEADTLSWGSRGSDSSGLTFLLREHLRRESSSLNTVTHSTKPTPHRTGQDRTLQDGDVRAEARMWARLQGKHRTGEGMGRAASVQAHPDICSVRGPVAHPSVSNAHARPRLGSPAPTLGGSPGSWSFMGGT